MLTRRCAAAAAAGRLNMFAAAKTTWWPGCWRPCQRLERLRMLPSGLVQPCHLPVPVRRLDVSQRVHDLLNVVLADRTRLSPRWRTGGRLLLLLIRFALHSCGFGAGCLLARRIEKLTRIILLVGVP